MSPHARIGEHHVRVELQTMGSVRTGSILVNDDGVCSSNADGALAWHLRWGDIGKIAAWKKDVLAYDIVCLGFQAADRDDFFYCDEHQDGWDTLVGELKNRFDVQSHEWLPQVLRPPFQEKFTIVWRRLDGKDRNPR
jgi:hypothetical protein